MKVEIVSLILITFILLFLHPLQIHSEEYDDFYILKSLLKKAKNPPKENYAKYSIFRKDDLLYCQGNSEVAIYNNKGADLIKDGKNKEAVKYFESILDNAALFLPFRYNLGIACYKNREYKKALLHLNKARLLVPEYYMTYIHIGNTFSLSGDIENSIINYRKAIRLNPKHIEALVLTGDGYLRINRIDMASYFYNLALEQDPFYNNAILGKSKILFLRRNYYKAYMNMRLINTKKDYNKSYHYYMAECAYKLQDYELAYEQYKKLLEFKGSNFFLTVSLNLIEHKRDLAKKFADQIKEGKDN